MSQRGTTSNPFVTKKIKCLDWRATSCEVYSLFWRVTCAVGAELFRNIYLMNYCFVFFFFMLACLPAATGHLNLCYLPKKNVWDTASISCYLGARPAILHEDSIVEVDSPAFLLPPNSHRSILWFPPPMTRYKIRHRSKIGQINEE